MKTLTAGFCVAAILALPVLAMASDGTQENPGKVISRDTVSVTGTVKAVDPEKRTITLALPDGKERTLTLERSVTTLDRVKPGDLVKATYQEAITVKLRKTKATPSITVQESTGREPKAEMPGRSIQRLVTAVTTIDKISDDGTMVTLMGPEGNSVDVKVRDPENLEKIRKGEIKKGDQVEISYYQALAVAVEKAGQTK
ncbi:hypothetical protein [Geobacter sp. SVR]|uniref:hypothetical protein n=1 Tax=Geobacter sp. SVR TaxID=2495594 RepID=UPI00143F028B|nr:hypothetical protein [Geobacter sp. SVR]BCS54177.1 hypothetical protein GSVR_24850 [Geobacter sp. SVR]GCF85964.1 hypothetical protein GSbR_25640 [Geobacter sp. SVR]